MTNEPKNPHAVALGKVGGKTKGPSKRRSPAHYVKLSAAGVKARWPGNAHQNRVKKREVERESRPSENPISKSE